MKKEILYNYNGYRNFRSRSSSICKELIKNTSEKKTPWISCEDFIEHLEVQGMAFDNVPWFHSYLLHIQKVRFFADNAETFFALYDDRLFAISQSKISNDFRLDFTSSFNGDSVWRRVIDSQVSLSRLHSFVRIFNTANTNEECEALLYATGCIHA